MKSAFSLAGRLVYAQAAGKRVAVCCSIGCGGLFSGFPFQAIAWN